MESAAIAHTCFINKVTPLPSGIAPAKVGPLFCGGITVFNPIVQFNVQPTDRVGVIGIGGLGHMALKFLHAWGCEVTAFSSNPAKEAEIRALGASHVVNSRDPQVLEAVANSFDFILSTVNADLPWGVYVNALRPKGRLHFVGVVPVPIQIGAFPIIADQKSISGTPSAAPPPQRGCSTSSPAMASNRSPKSSPSTR